MKRGLTLMRSPRRLHASRTALATRSGQSRDEWQFSAPSPPPLLPALTCLFASAMLTAPCG